MWLDLYLVVAVVAAVAVWLVSPQFASYDAPGDAARAVWSAVAGALWPLMVVGVAQFLAISYVIRRLRPRHSDKLAIEPSVALHDLSLRS